MNERSDPPLVGWRAPTAPPALRQRALRAAKDPGQSPTPRRIEDRIWESRPLRLGWLAAAAVLVALNLAVQDRATNPPTPAAVVAEAPAIDGDVGIEIPPPPGDGLSMAEAYELAMALLNDPCQDPWYEGDCT